MNTPRLKLIGQEVCIVALHSNGIIKSTGFDMESRSCCILPMNSGAISRDAAISLILLILLAPSVVAIVVLIVSFTLRNNCKYLVVLFSYCTAFICCRLLLVMITLISSTLGVGITFMFSTLWVGIGFGGRHCSSTSRTIGERYHPQSTFLHFCPYNITFPLTLFDILSSWN